MGRLEEIDEVFKDLLDIESDKLKIKLGDLKNRAKFSDYNKEFKKRISYLMKKREKEIKDFVSKHKDRLFPSEDKKEEKKKEGPKYLDIKHLDLKLSRGERFRIKRSIKKFKLKLWLSNIYYHVVPSWIFFNVFKIRFRISNFFKGVGRDLGYFFRRRSKKIRGSFTRLGLNIKRIYGKVLRIWKRFVGLFVRKKKEGEGEEEKEEGKDKKEIVKDEKTINSSKEEKEEKTKS